MKPRGDFFTRIFDISIFSEDDNKKFKTIFPNWDTIPHSFKPLAIEFGNILANHEFCEIPLKTIESSLSIDLSNSNIIELLSQLGDMEA